MAMNRQLWQQLGALAGVVLLVVVVCGDRTAQQARQVSLTFETPEQTPAQGQPGAEVVEQDSALTVVGRVRTPTPCYQLGSKLETRRDHLTLTVYAQPTEAELRAQVLAALPYRAQLQGNLEAWDSLYVYHHQTAQGDTLMLRRGLRSR